MNEVIAPVDRSPARAQPEEVERVRLAAEFERDRASVEVHRLLAMTVRETSCRAEANVEVTDFHRSLVELGPGFFGTGQAHTSGCHWARCTPHTVPLGLRDARRLCPEDGAIYDNVGDGFEILRRRGVRDVVGLVAPPGSDSGYEAAVRDPRQRDGSGRVIKLLRAIIGKHAVRLSNKWLIARVHLAMKCLQDRRAAKGHSQVIFDEPSTRGHSDDE
jgi:hypothetical protein